MTAPEATALEAAGGNARPDGGPTESPRIISARRPAAVLRVGDPRLVVVQATCPAWRLPSRPESAVRPASSAPECP